MEYVRLGRSGLKISKVILGGMSFGNPAWESWVLNESAALPLIEYAYKAGINTWDTADMYSNGDSERILGRALRKYNIPRQNVVIMTKCYFGVSHDGSQLSISDAGVNGGALVNRVGLSRKHIFDAVDASVERLGTYIDVLQIHRLDRDVPQLEIMRALNDVIESGKVRYIGASSMATWEFQQLQDIARSHGWHQFISMQNYLNLLYREEEREMLPYCRDTGVGIIPWSPVARGVLARPWGQRGTTREASDITLKALIRNHESEIDRQIVERVEEIAQHRKVPMAAVAMAWVLSKGAFPVVGLSSMARIDQAVAASTLQLTPGEINSLEEPYLPKEVTGY